MNSRTCTGALLVLISLPLAFGGCTNEDDADSFGGEESETAGDGDGDMGDGDGDIGDGDGDIGDGDGDIGDGDGDIGDGDGDIGDGDGDIGDGDGDIGDGDGDLPPDACDLVADQSYASQDQLECGLGPNGVELCNWTLSFTVSNYTWTYSDVGESSEYACSGLELISVPEAQPLGLVSADGSTLTWDGVLYLRD